MMTRGISRANLEALIETAIEMLNELDGDSDREPDVDSEPSGDEDIPAYPTWVPA